MNSLLYPAIAFMNRLSFGMKFSLVSVLFFVPMLPQLASWVAFRRSV